MRLNITVLRVSSLSNVSVGEAGRGTARQTGHGVDRAGPASFKLFLKPRSSVEETASATEAAGFLGGQKRRRLQSDAWCCCLCHCCFRREEGRSWVHGPSIGPGPPVAEMREMSHGMFFTACGFDKEVAPGLLTGQLNYIPLNGRTRANAN